MFLNVEITVLSLLIVFLILLFAVCGKKGFRSLLSLVATILILIGIVIPLIVQRYNPVLIVFIASVPTAIFIIYFTEGFNVLSHISIILTVINFAVISLLIYAAIYFSKLSGIVSDVSNTIGGRWDINLSQLLMAGIMLGTLGALIEMIVTQVGTVMGFINANPAADKKQIYKQSYTVGVIHLGSIINTLFLIYAGVLLPTLIVFSGSQNYAYSMLSYEPVSSEIIRVVIGAIGVIVAMPASTFFASEWFGRKEIIKHF